MRVFGDIPLLLLVEESLLGEKVVIEAVLFARARRARRCSHETREIRVRDLKFMGECRLAATRRTCNNYDASPPCHAPIIRYREES